MENNSVDVRQEIPIYEVEEIDSEIIDYGCHESSMHKVIYDSSDVVVELLADDGETMTEILDLMVKSIYADKKDDRDDFKAMAFEALQTFTEKKEPEVLAKVLRY